MEAIERMAALCMKDLDDEDGGEEDLEDDDELMVKILRGLVGFRGCGTFILALMVCSGTFSKPRIDAV